MRRENGQTMAEYSVVLAVITVALIATFGVFSEDIAESIRRVLPLIPG